MPSRHALPGTGAFCILGTQGKEALLNCKLCSSCGSGSAGVWKAVTCSDVSGVAGGKGREEHSSDQDQQILEVQVFINGYHSPCICVEMRIFAEKRKNTLGAFIHKAKKVT